MYLKADKITIDSDDNGFSLWIETDTGPVAVNIHGIDLDAFYDQVKARIGPYLRERDEALRTRPVRFECDPDESGGVAEYAVAIREDGSLRMEPDEDAYDPTDPKHRNFHSIHADIWDMREGK